MYDAGLDCESPGLKANFEWELEVWVECSVRDGFRRNWGGQEGVHRGCLLRWILG